MRTARATLAGLGATGTVVAAVVCVFVVASAVIAFDAWPGGGLGSGSRSLQVGGGAAPLRVTLRPDQASGATRSTRAAVARASSTPRGSAPVVAAPPRSGVLTPSSVQGAAVAAAAPAGPAGPVAASATTAPPRSGSPQQPVPPPSRARSTADAVAGTVQAATRELGGSVTQASGRIGTALGPVVGPAVSAVGGATGKTVTDLGASAGDVLRGTAPGTP